MYIPLVDLKIQYKNIKREIDSAIRKVINSTNFILGEEVELLEEEIAKYIGVKFAIGVASGTDALVLSLLALGINKGDEVITTPFTFIATSEAIVRVGAKPVFCDIDYFSYNIDHLKIERLINKRTKAIVLVHLYGLACEMERILELAKNYKLKIIEDCAQSFGSEYRGRKVGSFGDCGCFSFFPSKNLGCFGDGGMVVTNNGEIAKKIKMLRNHGSLNKYYYKLNGFNSRLDTIQAGILRVKLKYLENWIKKRIEVALLYNEFLKDIPNIITPKSPSWCRHTFNYYTLRIKNKKRSALQKILKENGISSAIYYPLCLHLQKIYKELGYRLGDFPIAEKAQEEVLSLPIYPELKLEKIKRITKIIRNFLLPIISSNNP